MRRAPASITAGSSSRLSASSSSSTPSCVVSQTRGGSITPQNPNGVVNGWGYWLVWVLLGAGVLVLALFSLLELFVVKDPVLDLRLFATRDFRIASIVTWVVRGIVFGSFLLIPIFLQQFQNRSAVADGPDPDGPGDRRDHRHPARQPPL